MEVVFMFNTTKRLEFEGQIFERFFRSMTEFAAMGKYLREKGLDNKTFGGICDIIKQSPERLGALPENYQQYCLNELKKSPRTLPWQLKNDWLVYSAMWQAGGQKRIIKNRNLPPAGWSPLVIECFCNELRNRNYRITPQSLREYIDETCYPNFFPTHIEHELVERKDILDRVTSHFKNSVLGEKAQLVCLKGPGGIGKTSIAIKYQQLQANRYHGLVALDMQKQDFVEPLQLQLQGLQLEVEEIENKWDFVKQALSKLSDNCGRVNKHLLVVFDNLLDESNDPAGPMLSSLLPTAGTRNIDILITSRYHLGELENGHFKLNYETVEEMTEEEAKALFMQTMQGKKHYTECAVKQLLSDLGFHPLAITLMAQHLRQHPDLEIEVLREEIKDTKINHEGFFQKLSNHQTDSCNDDYGLKASLLISVKALNLPYQYVLMVFALLPLRDSKIAFLRPLLNNVSSLLDIKEYKHDVFNISNRGINSKNLLHLRRLSLLDSSLNSKEHIRMHEVIHDFLKVYFYEVFQKPNKRHAFEELVTAALITVVEEQSRNKELDTHTLRTCTEFLLAEPVAFDVFDIAPGRIQQSLNFWFKNYELHQFLYDVSLLEGREAALSALIKHLKKGILSLSQSQQIVLYKFIAHTGYAQQDGNQVTVDELQQLVELCTSAYEAKPSVENKWYLIFSLDHLSNFLSKNENLQIQRIEQSKAVWQPVIQILDLLPSAIKSDDWPVYDDEAFQLLMRAAHFWGHRGNQNAYILEQSFLQNLENSFIDQLVDEGVNSYQKATQYRIAALFLQDKVFVKSKLLEQLRERAPTFLNWIDANPQPPTKVELFSTLYQGVGDTANQLRGVAWTRLLEICHAIKHGDIDMQQISNKIVKMADDTLFAKQFWGAANVIWDDENRKALDKKVQTPSIFKLKYEHHMPSVEVLSKVLLDWSRTQKLMQNRELEELISDTMANSTNETSYKKVRDNQPKVINSVVEQLRKVI